jgi:hypothetical protein
LDHPLMTRELASSILGSDDPELTVKSSLLDRASAVIRALADPSGQGQRALSVQAPLAVVADIAAVFDGALRAQQARLLKETGKARPSSR